MMHQVVTAMRKAGKTPAEIKMAKDDIFRDMRVDYADALRTSRELEAEYGLNLSSRERVENAFQILKSKMYWKMRDLQAQGVSFEKINEDLKQLVGWNERETAGIGGAVAEASKRWRDAMAQTGIPFPPSAFANAIGTSINRKLVWLGLPWFAGKNGSPWFSGEINRRQRMVEAVLGPSLGLVAGSLVAAGALTVRYKLPKDEDEKNRFTAAGHRKGTVEINLPNGEFIPVPLNVGPMALLAPALVGTQAAMDIATERRKDQEKLNADAAAKGLAPGTIPPVSLAQTLAVAGWAAATAVAGGRTSTGLAQAYLDPTLLSEGALEAAAKKAGAGFASAVVPWDPAFLEIQRMKGIYADPRMASFLQQLFPTAESGALRLNRLGEHIGTPDQLQQAVQTLTGGLYGPIDPKEKAATRAHVNWLHSDFKPPPLQMGRARDFNGVLRPMTQGEFQKYVQANGTHFKEELSKLDVTSLSPEEAEPLVREAYRRADQQALQSIGVTPPRRATAPAAGPAETAQKFRVSRQVSGSPITGYGGTRSLAAPSFAGIRLPTRRRTRRTRTRFSRFRVRRRGRLGVRRKRIRA
jgi:hypothetical protein